MGMVRVELQTPNGITYDDTEIPDDYVTEEIIEEIVDMLEFPRISHDSKHITYSLLFVDKGIPLINGQTLLNAGLINGSAIRLVASQELSVDSSAAVDSSHFIFGESVRPTQSLQIFLCHSSSDKQIVRELYRRLVSDGFDPWLDEENILPGQDWNEEIIKAVRESDVAIVCLSEKSINKAGYIQKEIKYALDIADEKPDGTIFLIPLKLEECNVPERIRRWQWVSFFEERGYERLLKALIVKASQIGLKVGGANNTRA